jgi:hypothetical protein
MSNEHDFDFLSGVNPNSFLEPVPPGDYTLRINEVELKDTQAGGKRIAVSMTVNSGRYTGKKVWASYNVVNANTEVQDRHCQDWSSLVLAAGYIHPSVIDSGKATPEQLKHLESGLITKLPNPFTPADYSMLIGKVIFGRVKHPRNSGSDGKVYPELSYAKLLTPEMLGDIGSDTAGESSNSSVPF